MAIIDDALSRLRQHAVDLEVMAQNVRRDEPGQAALADRILQSARDAAEDVETVRILAFAAPVRVPTAAKQMAYPVLSSPAAVVFPPAPQMDALLDEALAAHDRDFAIPKDGLPAHRAGELPESCTACSVFAVLLDPIAASSDF